MKALVVGGTGTIGGAVVREAMSRGVVTRILTRSPEKAQALGVEAVAGDLAKPDTLEPAFRGVDALCLSVGVGPDETARSLAALDAAKAAGVGRLVYVSVAMPPGSETIPHVASKIPVEQAVRASGLPWTILRPNDVFQNDASKREAIGHFGVYPRPIGGRGLNRVDARDVAEIAVNALSNPSIQGVIPVNGPRGLTGDDIARIYSELLGRTVRYIGDDVATWARQVATRMDEWDIADLSAMFRFLQDHGSHASGTDFAAQQRALGHAPRPFEAFAADLVADWQR